ncbi:MAG TPA: hypothetical protein ENJ33_04730 [Thiothrix sp.]|nr:hypothetical protein [Thiothrix sp.]
MKITIKKQLSQLILGVAILSTSFATFAGEKTLKGDNRIEEGTISALIDASLPDWDESILHAKSSSNPLARLSFNTVAKVLGDKEFEQKPPEGATQLAEGNRFVRLDPKKGKMRYVNRTHAWNFEKDAKTKAIPEKEAQKIALNSFERLGFSLKEMKEPLVRTQMAGGAKAGAKEIEDLHEMYRLVYVQRQINGLPIYGNNIRIALSNEGQVQRLGINWASFKMDNDARLRSRKDIIQHAVKEIMTQDPDSSMKIVSALAYAKTDKGSNFKPVAVVSVNSLPTPYQLLIPLTDLANKHDND